VPVAAGFEVAPQQADQGRVVEQNGAPAAALGQRGDVLIVVGEVEAIDVDREGFADAHAGGGEQGEQQPVAVFVRGDGSQYGIDVSGRHRVERGRRVRSRRVIGSASISSARYAQARVTGTLSGSHSAYLNGSTSRSRR